MTATFDILATSGEALHALRELGSWADELELVYAWATAARGTAEHWRALPVDQVRRVVIGIHFAQTEPYVLETFAARGWATVTVDVFPAVIVRLDGRSKGELSGRQSFRVAAGSHRVVFVHAHRTETVEVDLAAGEQKTLTVNAFRAQ